ncbi:hypothetical protein QZH41_007491 [Actinostola sp. cb2023]|nr:hypothetical protein QZH41_007491 [Actinostola sp. cb2023]
MIAEKITLDLQNPWNQKLPLNASTMPPSCGLKYSTYTADEDTTTESHIKYRVDYETSKKTDRNHASRTLGNRLYAVQKSLKGLTPVVITYILKLFAYCVAKHQGKPEELKRGLKSLVCHAFGDHTHCDSSWCGALKDPSTYRHRDLPGGKPLSDVNLRAAIEDALNPFDTLDWAKKLADCGSSQANECVNGVVATKAPKTRHYGASESINFRVAAGVCQYNEDLDYLTHTTKKKLGLDECVVTTEYVKNGSLKRKREQERKKKWSVKRRRKELKKTRVRVKEREERKEGCSYESGIAVTEEGKVVPKGVLNETLNNFSEEDLHTIDGLVNNYEQMETPSEALPPRDHFKCFTFDLETTGLKRDSEIVQIACASLENKEITFNSYSVPVGSISPQASKVNKLSTSFRSGKKVLLRDNKVVCSDINSQDALENFVIFLERNSDDPSILIAHNGDNFDFPILLHSLVKYSLYDRVAALNFLFLDSLKMFSEINKESRNEEEEKGQRQLKPSSFKFEVDPSGRKFVTMTHDELTKNHPGGVDDVSSTEKYARMYETEDVNDGTRP